MEEKQEIRLRVLHDDDDTESPRAWDNLGTMVCWYRRYNLGDEQPKCSPEEWREGAELPEGTIILPLYVYEHGGITMSTGAFGDRWDSGQVGWIYVTPEKIQAEYGAVTDETRKNAKACLRAEVKVYASYLEGDVWCFVVEKVVKCGACGHVKYEHEDSCGGFFGDCKDAIAEHLPDEAKSLLDAAWENRT